MFPMFRPHLDILINLSASRFVKWHALVLFLDVYLSAYVAAAPVP